MANAYQVQVRGTTYVGNSGDPINRPTAYTPIENFNSTGLMTVEAPIPASNQNNEPNSVDVGFFVGNVLDAKNQAGEIQFATNTAIFTEPIIRNIVPGNSSQRAAIDVTRQRYDPQSRVLNIEIDSSTAVSAQLNSFIKTTGGITVAPNQIIDGNMQIQFSEDLRTVSGKINLLGNGYIQPGISLYSAEFQGVLSQNFVGFSER